MAEASVGRIVHFCENEKSPPVAALVTAVDETDPSQVKLTIFLPGEEPAPLGMWVNYADPPKGGCWSWPPRV